MATAFDTHQLLAAARTPIEPVRTTLAYRLATAVVAFLMVLLPLIYVALIGLIVYGVYWHLTTNTGILTADVRGKAKLMVVLAYFAPAIVGTILVAFMGKPLFARRPKAAKPRTLRREDEPFLFEFVNALCDSVGAPRPKSILLDDDANAAAALMSSVWNPFRNNLMLVIGLPLVAGMSVRQLSGVLAHEFGHFSQGAGMRFQRVIRAISNWFAFVVYQRDSWDEQLETWSKTGDLRYTWVLWIARGGVWLTRRILQGLMFVGHAMSCRLSREMEFDADRHFVRFSGSSQFGPSFERLGELVVARRWAISDLSDSYREGRLVDDFFELLARRTDMLTAEDRREIHGSRLSERTGWFDTHPALSDRIANAERENAAGVFQVESPASVLFRDFSATCRTETLNFYQWQVGEVAANQLVPVGKLLARQKALLDQDEALERVLADLYSAYWVLPFPDELRPPHEPVDQVLRRIQELRARVAKHAAAHDEAIKAIHTQQTFEQEANLAELLLRGNVKIGKDTFRVPMTSPEEVAAVRKQIAAAKAAAFQPLSVLLRDFADRLLLPLQLLEIPEVAARIPDADSLRDEGRHLVRSVVELRAHHDTLFKVNDVRELLQDVSKQLEGREQNETFLNCLRMAAEQATDFLKEVRQSLDATRYPFDHLEKGASIARYLLPEMPPPNSLGAIHAALTNVMTEGLRITTRAVSRLCVIVEQVETALGLPLGEKPAKAHEVSQ